MATVRKPSSLAARKMRMAISLRLAASSLRIGLVFFISAAIKASREILHCFMQRTRLGYDFFDLENEFVICVENAVAIFLPQARIQNWNSSIDAEAVTVVVRGVVRKRAEGERVLNDVFGVPQQRKDEIAAADVMREVAEEGAAIWVVAHILNDRAAVSVGLRPAEILFGRLREFLPEERLDMRLPSSIDDGFVRENSVGMNRSRQHQQNGDLANHDYSSASKKMIHDSR